MTAREVEVVREVLFTERAVPPPPPITAQSAILVDADTGKVLYERHAHERRPMASTTKIMTALLALEHARMNDTVVVSEHASKTPYTGLYLKPGEKLTVGDLLWALLLRSANDACVAIGEHIAGSEEKFVEMMNARALEMGLKNTHFKNPHGLHAEDHYSTAYDLAQMTRVAMQHPLFAQIVARKRKRIDRSIEKQDVVVVNKNRLLFRWDAVDGVKTGYTRQAGHCLVASASQDGWRLISVVLKSGNSWGDSRTLLEHGFRQYERVLVARKGTPLLQVRVVNGLQDSVQAMLVKDLSVVVPRGTKVDVRTEVTPGMARAPLWRGDSLGIVVARQGETELGRSLLLAADPVEPAPKPLLSRFLFFGLAGFTGLLALSVVVRHGRKAAQSTGRRRRRLAP
ncbi:MAG TPA: D-alanyl-D-alanine carboxypeptidase family protein [Armatimonadota bacterium]|nr:D-alanyl-D-alanine carboxypeptidase [Armatimonadota bacterium]HOJ20105.1 D-alanyl-D-alanine carboxypeptidase family protein [Armatimonadota bacterium]HOM82358.1 D-alanyl-D-alanine carboxypeptidase family protein [Armatimonadota bacterium]HPO72008.1 D-alanyl-D-alanine carboxypeptidase family protein [Armatimonadota bacterium]HPT98952.1 D-alanyl-D-alanine carboxypeptidase family protein [Armatimonadota bacterium]